MKMEPALQAVMEQLKELKKGISTSQDKVGAGQEELNKELKNKICDIKDV
jgi:hypothetical protein